MIFRRPIRDVVEERHGRTCGMHVFVFYIVALSLVLAMSTACLSATDSGYFTFDQTVEDAMQKDDAKPIDDLDVDYKITYGWRSVCSLAVAEYTHGNGEQLEEKHSGCFGLSVEPQYMERSEAVVVGGRSMDADTGLAVALGHAVAAAVAATHILFFVLLYFNVDPAPVRGYLYMRGLGLMSALTSFYLLFTCVVSFFFAIKGSLDVNMSSSVGLRPSWAYVLTVIDVAVMVIAGMLACQDDEVDAAIATPQYTSSSRDEDTVKRANGKLLHLRSKSSDTVCETSTSVNGPAALVNSAPKATVGGIAVSSGGGLVASSGGARPAAAAVMEGLGARGILQGGGGAGGTFRMSSVAASASAHVGRLAAAAAAVSSPAGSGSGSDSVRSSWTGGISALSPRRGKMEGDEEQGGGGGGGAEGEGGASNSRSSPRSSGGILDAALLSGAQYVGGDDGDGTGGGGSLGSSSSSSNVVCQKDASSRVGQGWGGPGGASSVTDEIDDEGEGVVVVVVVPGDGRSGGSDGQGATNDERLSTSGGGDAIGIGCPTGDDNGHHAISTAPEGEAKPAATAGSEPAHAAAPPRSSWIVGAPTLASQLTPAPGNTMMTDENTAVATFLPETLGGAAAAAAANMPLPPPSEFQDFSTARTTVSVAFGETTDYDEPLDIEEAGGGGGDGVLRYDGPAFG